jgi:molybdenum cofactor biosynthesis protein B
MAKATDDTPQSLAVAVLTVSDTRTEADDTSGKYLVEALESAGHRQGSKAIVIDDVYRLREEIQRQRLFGLCSIRT